MSMRGEINDFLNAFSKFSEQKRKRHDSDVKEKYYNALIDKAAKAQDLAERKLKLQDSRARASLGLRAQSLNNTQDYRAARLKQIDRSIDQRAAGKGGSDLLAPVGDGQPANTVPNTGVPNTGSGWSPQTGPTQAWPGKQSAVDTGDEETNTAANDATGDNTPNAAVDTGDDQSTTDVAENKPDNEPEDDEDNDEDNDEESATKLASDEGDTEFLAEGGEVTDNPKQGAVDISDQSEQQSVTPMGNGSGTSTKDGFDMNEALNRWKTGETQNPVALGLKGIIQTYGLAGRGALPGEDRSLQDNQQRFHRGEGVALNDQELHAMDRTVDPANELNASARMVKKLDMGVNYWIAKGDPQKASKVAQALIMRAKLDAEKYGRYAVNELRQGNTAHALDFLKKAYDLVPDGQHLDASVTPDGKIAARVIDSATGEAHDLGQLDAPQVLRFATGVANGQEYMIRMAQIASGNIGRQVQKENTPPKENVPKLKDRTEAAGAIDTAMQPGEGGKPIVSLPAGHEDTVKDIARQVLGARNNIMPNDAVRIANGLVDPTKPNDMLQPQQDGSAVVKLGDGRTINVPRNAVLQIAAVRGALMKKKGEEDAKAKADADAAAERDKKRSAIKSEQGKRIVEDARKFSSDEGGGTTPADLGRGVADTVGRAVEGVKDWWRHRGERAVEQSRRAVDPDDLGRD